MPSKRFPGFSATVKLAATAGFTVFLLCPGRCLSQPVEKPRAGRLSDGRAYRTDAQGFRLVDQIAELEVSNDDLRRQLRAMENELIDKQAALERLNAGKPMCPPPVSETTLTSTKPKTGAAKDTPDCNQLVSSLYLKVNRLEEELKTAKTAVPVAAPVVKQPVAEPRCDYSSPDNPLLEQVTKLQNALMQGPSKERYGALLAQQEDLAMQLAKTKGELEHQLEGRKELEAKLNEKEELIASLKAQPPARSVRAEEPEARSAMASETPPPAAITETPKIEPPAPVEVEAKEEESEGVSEAQVAAARVEFKESLGAIQSGIMERKGLLDTLKGKDKGISISAQPLVTPNGVSLDTLRGQVTKLDSKSDIKSIRNGLASIRRILDEDVSVLRRLLKK